MGGPSPVPTRRMLLRAFALLLLAAPPPLPAVVLLDKQELLLRQRPHPPSAGASPSPRHIVYVLSDNVGHANIGFSRRALAPPGSQPDPGLREVHTPNLDLLASTGVELQRFYTYKMCSPSRSSLLSGRLPHHVNMHNSPQTAPGAGIPAGMTTMPAFLKTAGYHTHQLGKYHVGFSTAQHTPKARGFDTSFGYLFAYNDYLHEWGRMHCPLGGNASSGSVPYAPAEGASCTQRSYAARNLSFITDLWETTADGREGPAYAQNGTGFEETLLASRAEQIIDSHDPSQPLFLFYAMHFLHSPLCVPDDILARFLDIDNEDRRYVAAMAFYMDQLIGRLVARLLARDMWKDTLFVWTSDNGAAIELNTGAKNSFPLRGGYYTNWEGGVRAPALVNGGLLPPAQRGQARTGFVHIADWLATFCALAGCIPNDTMAASYGLPPVDSMNLLPYLFGEVSESPRTEFVLTPLIGDVDSHGGDSAIISGRFKLILRNVSQASWEGPFYPNNSNTWDTWDTVEQCTTPEKVGCLFDIFEDPTEHTDLALAMPDVANALLAKLWAAQEDVYDPDRGSEDPAACAHAVQANRGFWGPWRVSTMNTTGGLY